MKTAQIKSLNHKDQFCWFRYINSKDHTEIKIYNKINHPAPMTIQINGITHQLNIAIEPLYLPGYTLVAGDLFFDGITKEEAEGIAQIRTEAFQKAKGKLKRLSRRQYYDRWVQEMKGKPIVRELSFPQLTKE